MVISNQSCQEWLADYRRLQWHQFVLERELNKMHLSEKDALECDDENDRLLLEKHEKRLAFELQVLRECLLQNEDHGAVEGNGWLRHEHLLLLRMLGKWRDADLERRYITSLCGKSEEEIRQHLEWLRKSRREREKQRSDVLRWKQDRAAILDQLLKEKACSVKGQQMKRLDDETRRRISAWKEERDRQRQVQLKMEEEEESCRRQEELRIARLRLRRRDLDRKKDPERCDDVKTDEHGEDEEAKLRRMSLGRLRKRDAAIVEERRNAIRRLRSRSSSEVVGRTAVPRDPERLFRPTRVWEARCKEADRESTDFRQHYVLHLQKRAVPSWRNLS